MQIGRKVGDSVIFHLLGHFNIRAAAHLLSSVLLFGYTERLFDDVAA